MATQLTLAERYQIYALKKAGHSKTQIAAQLGRHPSTIGRELDRNRGERGYRPQQAHRKAEERKQQRLSPRISRQSWELIESLPEQDWSPEQLSGWLKAEKKLCVSHEWIYQYIYAEKTAGGELWQHLRWQKRRRKRYGSYYRRGQLPHRISIDQRPAIVEPEPDSVIGNGSIRGHAKRSATRPRNRSFSIPTKLHLRLESAYGRNSQYSK